MEAVTQTKQFIDETVDELKKVTWPDWPQLRNATFVVLVFVVIVSAIIWGMDLIVRNIFDVIIDIFAG